MTDGYWTGTSNLCHSTFFLFVQLFYWPFVLSLGRASLGVSLLLGASPTPTHLLSHPIASAGSPVSLSPQIESSGKAGTIGAQIMLMEWVHGGWGSIHSRTFYTDFLYSECCYNPQLILLFFSTSKSLPQHVPKLLFWKEKAFLPKPLGMARDLHLHSFGKKLAYPKQHSSLAGWRFGR